MSQVRSPRRSPTLESVPAQESGSAIDRVPVVAGGWPGLGHLFHFQRDPIGLLMRGFREQGEIFEFRLGTQPVVVFVGPRAHEVFFRAPSEQLGAREVYQFTVPIFGRGVAYDTSPEVMGEQLGFLYPALRDARMQTYARYMFEETASFLDGLGPSGELDLPVATNELTVRIASRCLLGEEIRSRLDSGFARLYHDLQKGINLVGFIAPRLPTPAHRRRDRARLEVARLIGGILAARRETGHAPDDFMQALMEGRYADGRALSDDEITGILLTVLFAGQHTSAVLAAWTGLELLRHPEYLARVHAEIEEIYRAGEPMSLATLKRQILLEQAVRETERLHPPLVMLMRKVLRPMQYAGYRVGAGSLAMVSPALAHLLPHVFASPERFDPERFASPRSEDKQHPHALIGFGGGKHRCMGMHFAYLQIKALWTVLLRGLELELLTPHPSPNYRSWVVGPRGDCRVRYRRREIRWAAQ